MVNEWDRGEVKTMEVHDLLKKPEYADLHNFAALNASIYVDNKSDPVHSIDRFCQDIYKKKKDEKEIKYIPYEWKRVDSIPAFPEVPTGNFKINGLKYQVFIKETQNSPTQAVIVFRGTDFNSPGDWITNLRWIARLIPFSWDQYDQTRALIPPLVEYIRNDYGKDVRIVTTGHSLGGGLAQQALYVTPYIKHAYAFNSTVVTGFYDVEEFSERDINKVGVSVFKISERGEILQYLRNLFRPFTLLSELSEKDPHIFEVSSNFYGGEMVEQHGMKRLACKLLPIASN